MIDFGELPNNNSKSISSSVPDAEFIMVNLTRSYWRNSSSTSIYTFTHKEIDTVMMNGNYINISSNANLNNHYAYICVEYTKTTD